MKIVLLGYMGSGKSVIGKSLSESVNQSYKDLDAEIEKIEGYSISEIFNKKGEIYFRKKEREILETILKQKNNFVLSLGGGTPCLGNVMEFLNSHEDVLTVYLKASNDTLTDRLFLEKESRPMISHISTKKDLNEFIRKHLFERSYYYSQAKQAIIVDDKSVSEIVAEIVVRLF